MNTRSSIGPFDLRSQLRSESAEFQFLDMADGMMVDGLCRWKPNHPPCKPM